MAQVNILDNTGSFINMCSSAIRIRDTTNNWQMLNEGAKVYVNGQWMTLSCNLSNIITITGVPKTNIPGARQLGINFNNYDANGDFQYLPFDITDGTAEIRAVKNTQIILRWDNRDYIVKVNGAIIANSNYTFTPVASLVDIQYIER